MGGTSEVHKDSDILASSFEDDGRGQSEMDFAAPSAVKPAKTPAETTDAATDTTPQTTPEDEAADDADEMY